MLRVVAAAIQLDGLTLSLPPPARHAHVLRASHDLRTRFPAPEAQGFLLSDGTFADRKRAYIVARASGQPWLRRDGKQYYQGEDLFSEDVW